MSFSCCCLILPSIRYRTACWCRHGELLESECRIGSSQQKDAIKQLVAGVKQGEQLHVLMGQNKFFPRLMTTMVRVGESAGKLEYLFSILTEHYTRQQQLRRKFLGAIAYPAFMLTFSIGVVSLLIYLMGILPAGGGQMTDLLGWGLLRGGSGVLIFWTYLLFSSLSQLERFSAFSETLLVYRTSCL